MKPREEEDMGKKIKFGPGFLVTAAFIGPGTVTSASLAGAKFGYSLLWVILISGFLTFVLQEMAGRFSLLSGHDLSSALMQTAKFKILNIAFASLAVLAVVGGAAAYEAGNITGAYIGLDAIYPSGKIWAYFILVLALIFLWGGRYRGIEVFLMGLVALMSLAFLLTAVKSRPQILPLLSGLIPHFPGNSTNLAVALLGTTVVPYNLFLYSSVVHKRWGRGEVSLMRKDLAISISVGIMITAAILITSSSAFFRTGIEVNSASTMALQLRPLLGRLATVSFSSGLFAAGLSSAITAPYAAAWLLRGIAGFKENSIWFKLTSTAVVLFGFSSLFFGIKPLKLIVLAQVANGLILPLVVIFLGFSILKKNREPGQFILVFVSLLMVFLIIIPKFAR